MVFFSGDFAMVALVFLLVWVGSECFLPSGGVRGLVR